MDELPIAGTGADVLEDYMAGVHKMCKVSWWSIPSIKARARVGVRGVIIPVVMKDGRLLPSFTRRKWTPNRDWEWLICLDEKYCLS